MKEFRDFLPSIWNKGKIYDRSVLRTAVEWYNYFFVDNHKEYGLQRMNRMSENCDPCNQKVTSGLKKIVLDELIPLADVNRYNKRKVICSTCPKYDKRTDQCLFFEEPKNLQIYAKFNESKCPKEKW